MGFKDWMDDTAESIGQAMAFRRETRLIRHRLKEADEIIVERRAEIGHFPYDEKLPPSYHDEMILFDDCMTRRPEEKFAVQDFLNRKSPFLAGYVDPGTGARAADLIIVASKKSKIDCKLILTGLQREQSAVRAKSLSQHKLDWILGVGCYEDGRRLGQYKGFGTQILEAAKIYRRHYDNWFKGKVVSVNFGRRTLVPQNAATYSLYRYNPQTSGALLTRKIWFGFFGT